jgi:hypothetical protein
VGERHRALRVVACRRHERDERRSAEPGLDVRPVVDGARARTAEQLREALVELVGQGRLVGEAGKVRQEVADLLELVAGQVSAGGVG